MLVFELNTSLRYIGAFENRCCWDHFIIWLLAISTGTSPLGAD